MSARKVVVGLFLAVSALVGIAPAHAYSLNGGEAPQPAAAEGQSNAVANCEAAVLMQEVNEVWPGGGPKVASGYPGPLNCDHWFQKDLGLIGNQ